jgi:hypothetical protein
MSVPNHLVKTLQEKMQRNPSHEGVASVKWIAGSDGEMDCIISNWDDKLKNVFELTEHVYTVILGQKMADGFI